MRHLDPLALAGFVAVAEACSFSVAAKRVGRTQSTVSAQVARLEDDLGVRLFDRTTRSVRITEDGQRLLHDARRFLRLEAQIIDRFAAAPLDGTVRLGASDDLASGHALAALAARFCRAHPRIRLVVTVGNGFDLADRARAGALDLAVAKMAVPPADAVVLWRDTVVWAAAPDFDLAAEDLPLAVFPEPCLYRVAATAALSAADRTWRIVYESPSFGGLLAAVDQGIAAAPMAGRIIAGRPMAPVADLPPLGAYAVVLVRGPTRSAAADAIAEELSRSPG